MPKQYTLLITVFLFLAIFMPVFVSAADITITRNLCTNWDWYGKVCTGSWSNVDPQLNVVDEQEIEIDGWNHLDGIMVDITSSGALSGKSLAVTLKSENPGYAFGIHFDSNLDGNFESDSYWDYIYGTEQNKVYVKLDDYIAQSGTYRFGLFPGQGGSKFLVDSVLIEDTPYDVYELNPCKADWDCGLCNAPQNEAIVTSDCSGVEGTYEYDASSSSCSQNEWNCECNWNWKNNNGDVLTAHASKCIGCDHAYWDYKIAKNGVDNFYGYGGYGLNTLSCVNDMFGGNVQEMYSNNECSGYSASIQFINSNTLCLGGESIFSNSNLLNDKDGKTVRINTGALKCFDVSLKDSWSTELSFVDISEVGDTYSTSSECCSAPICTPNPDFNSDPNNCGGCGIICLANYICQAAICALPPPPPTDIEARSIELSYTDSNGRKVIVGNNDLLIEGINYTIRSTAYARKYPKEGDILNKLTFARFLINGNEVALGGMFIGDGKVIGGVIPDDPYILIRQLELAAGVILKKEHVNLDPNANLGNVNISVAWNQEDYKPVEETVSDPFKNNNISKNYKGKVIVPDLAVLQIDVLNKSNDVISGYAIKKSSDTLLINMTYGNIGLKNITESFKVDLYVNTKTGRKKLDSVSINGIPSQTNGSFIVKWKVFPDKDNCPYGECNFTGEISVLDEELNKINNNLAKEFDVVAVRIESIDKGLKLYEETAKEIVFRRDQEYKIKVRFWGKNPGLNITKFNYKDDPNVKITAGSVTYLEKPVSKEITYTLVNPSSSQSPVGIYTAHAYSSFKDNNGSTVSAVAELGKNYSVIYDSTISKADGSYEAYLYGENSAILMNTGKKNGNKVMNGYRHRYTFGTERTFYPDIMKQSNISFYTEKITDINPQDKHTFELAIAAIDGTKSVEEALDKIGKGIANTFKWDETGKEETPMKALKGIKVEEFVKAANGTERQPRIKALCYVYSMTAVSILRSIGIPSTTTSAPHVEINGTGHAWVEVYNPRQIAGNDWFAYEPQGPDFTTRENYFNTFGTPIDRFAEITRGEPNWVKDQKIDWDPVKVDGKWVYTNFRGYIAIQNYTSGVVTKSTEDSARDISLIKNLYQVKK